MGAVRTFPGRTTIEASVVFPDGTELLVKSIVSVQITTGAPTVVNVGLGETVAAFTFTASSASQAQNIRSQIADAINGITTGRIQIIDPGIALSFSAVIPAAISVPVLFNATVQGTGFATAGITHFKLDDGAGHVHTNAAAFFDGSNMGFYDGIVTFAAVYTLYYSTDGGTSWTTTALTVTAT